MAVLFWIFLDQICPKWIKLDQTGFLTNRKMLTMAVLFWIFLDQICPNLIKLDFHLSKNVIIKSCHIFKKNKNGHFVFGFFWIRSVQNGSSLQIR